MSEVVGCWCRRSRLLDVLVLPQGVKIELLDEAALQVDGDAGDVEKQQREVMDDLRAKLSKAEAIAVTKSEQGPLPEAPTPEPRPRNPKS
jgi:hypothetical protein